MKVEILDEAEQDLTDGFRFYEAQTAGNLSTDSWSRTEDMPTVMRKGPYRFFFVSHDSGEPPHVHVRRDKMVAKFWIDPVALERTGGFSRTELNAISNLVHQHRTIFWRDGMNSSTTEVQQPRARCVSISEDALTVDLIDGCTIIVPLAWYPRLWHGVTGERERFEVFADGAYIHWPDLDEDIAVDGLLSGCRSGETPTSLKKWIETRKAGNGT